mgnify:CR=1 FL=1
MNTRYQIELIISLACSIVLVCLFILAKPILDSSASNTDLILPPTTINEVIYQDQLKQGQPWSITNITLVEANNSGVLLEMDFHYTSTNTAPAQEIKLSASLAGQNTYGQSFSIKTGNNRSAMLFTIMDKDKPLELPSEVDLQLSFDHIKDNRYKGRIGEIKKVRFALPVNAKETT